MKIGAIATGEKEFDFITNLPLPILHSIVGRLTIKEAARTSVLSKR